MHSAQIDGTLVKNAIITGAQNVIEHQEFLNKINVFPVPDGDTGSNMAAAFESIVETLFELPDNLAITEICHHAADAALNGSRGNSGAILAQFFQGFYEGLGQHHKIGMEKFAEAAVSAATAAHNAISNPVEGTIITVMRDWATWVSQNWNQLSNFLDLFEQSLSAAKKSLEHTTDQLKVLSKNHVVDAGAQGFYYFIEGVTLFVRTGKLPQQQNKNQPKDAPDETSARLFKSETNERLHLGAHGMHGDDLEHQYCTECIIHGDNLDVAKVKAKVARWGSSFVIVGGRNKIKIHIHTNAPDKVFKDANFFGELLETKADDMWAQYRANINFHLNKKVALVTDTSCNLPQELMVRYNIITVPLQLIINQKVYLDRVNLSPDDFFEKLNDPNNKITTSQPATNDIKATFNKALSNSSTAIGIFVSDKLSGTFRSIAHVAKQYEDEELSLFDSRSATSGLGLIVLEAAKAIQQGQPLASIKKSIQDNIAYTCNFIAFSTLKHAIKGGRVSKSTGLVAQLFKLLPIIKLDSSGKVEKIGMGFGQHNTQKKMLKKAIRYAQSFKDQELLIAHADALGAAKRLHRQLRKRFPDKTIHIVEITPILATHSGPGALCISVLGKTC